MDGKFSVYNFEEIGKSLPFSRDAHIAKFSEMIESERDFIAGLVSTYKPRKILEIGVSAGSSSTLLLASSSSNAEVHSVDTLRKYYRDSGKSPVEHQRDTGFVVKDHFPQFQQNWHLHTNGVTSTFIEEIGGDIDFVLLDAAHGLPGELLDFLTILPFASENCIFILHDVSINLAIKTKSTAPKIMMCTVKAEKIFPRSKMTRHNSHNICAFMVGKETRAISNLSMLFHALTLDWVVPITDHKIEEARKVLDRYYPAELVSLYEVAANHHVSQR